MNSNGFGCDGVGVVRMASTEARQLKMGGGQWKSGKAISIRGYVVLSSAAGTELTDNAKQIIFTKSIIIRIFL